MRYDEINVQKVSCYGKKSYGLRLLAKDLPEGARELKLYSGFYNEIYKYFLYEEELEKRIRKFEQKTNFKIVVKDQYETEDAPNATILVVEFKVVEKNTTKKRSFWSRILSSKSVD